jgi:hypothetical protein
MGNLALLLTQRNFERSKIFLVASGMRFLHRGVERRLVEYVIFCWLENVYIIVGQVSAKPKSANFSQYFIFFIHFNFSVCIVPNHFHPCDIALVKD